MTLWPCRYGRSDLSRFFGVAQQQPASLSLSSSAGRIVVILPHFAGSPGWPSRLRRSLSISFAISCAMWNDDCSAKVAERRVLAYQHTLARTATVSGIGLHTGARVQLRLTRAPANTGIVFRRVDLEGFAIEARAKNVARVSYATSLMKKGVLISTTEHLLSALAASSVDNAFVDIDNLEVPIIDGSALPFWRLIQQAGLKQQRARRTYAKVLKPVEVVEGNRRVSVFPANHLRITCRIEFPHPLISEQSMDF